MYGLVEKTENSFKNIANLEEIGEIQHHIGQKNQKLYSS